MSGPSEYETFDGLSSDEIAAERFAHGLLAFLHEETEARQDERISDAMERIRSDVPAGAVPRASRFKLPMTFAAAAVLALTATLLLVMSPTQSAYALVDTAILAMQRSDGLRYEVYASDPDDSTLSDIGLIDMQRTRFVGRIEAPEGHDLVIGRDDEGEWSLRLDGSVERYHPRRVMPRWISVGENTILFDSLDQLLGRLAGDYDVRDEDGEIVATRREGARRPGPSELRITLSSGSSVVDRLEMRWSRAERGPRRGSPHRRASGPPERRGHPPMRGAHPGPDGGGHDGARRRRPSLLEGAPGFESGAHPPPPERVVFQRTPAPEFPDGHFSPDRFLHETPAAAS